MKVIIQRCKNASVAVDNKIVGKINNGYTLFVGFSSNDKEDTLDKMANKIINLRIFEDENEKMNYDIKRVKGSILSISQFTLYAKLEGRSPSFTDAMKYDLAKEMYVKFNSILRSHDINVEEGIFGADMKVELLNDGPVTILIDSESDL